MLYMINDEKTKLFDEQTKLSQLIMGQIYTNSSLYTDISYVTEHYCWHNYITCHILYMTRVRVNNSRA